MGLISLSLSLSLSPPAPRPFFSSPLLFFPNLLSSLPASPARFDGLKYEVKKLEGVVYDLSIRGLVKAADDQAAMEE